MTEKQLLVKRLKAIEKDTSGDEEVDHIKADRCLLDYIGDPVVSKAFDAIHKWYA